MSFLDAPRLQTELTVRCAAIRLAIFDVDGVMTDGKLYLGSDGSEIKTMHVRDGLGLKRLMAAGITPAVISGRASAMVARRMAELGVEHVFLASDDKIRDYQSLLATLAVSDDQVAMMGDDLPDLDLMQRAGVAFAVANAVPEVIQAADWVSHRNGGEGAVREACELLISAREQSATTAESGR